MDKTELLGMSREKIEDFAVRLGEQRFRGRQIYRWIYKRNVSSFYDMSDLPKDLRQKFDETASVSVPKVVKARTSRDSTRKFLLELNDRKRIETVVIPQRWNQGKKFTACISTQVGCPLGCTFCATGHSGYERDLTVGEIVGQVLVAEREIIRREKYNEDSRAVSNLVFMGMGEPLLNLDAVLEAIHLINDDTGINIGQRHITLSTAGFIPGINRLKEEDLQITLAVSLHAADDELRSRIVPLNRKYPLKELMPAVADYADHTGRRVTFEYVLLEGINTSIEDAARLARLVKPILANVNLIPYNHVDGIGYSTTETETARRFMAELESQGITATLREEMGADIEAACGQLRRRNTK